MENKADVKAMLARFQSGPSLDETSSTSAGRIKQPLQPTLSGPSTQRKPFPESFSGSAIPSKPFALKSTPSTKSDSDAHESNKIKAMANRFACTQDDINTSSKPPVINKLQTNLKPIIPQTSEAKGPIAPLNKPSIISAMSEPKAGFPKPPAAFNSKPSWAREESGSTASNTSPTPPKIPEQKPISNVRKMWQQTDEQTDANVETSNKPSPQANIASKPVLNFKTAQNMFNKETSEQTESGGANKKPFTVTNTTPPPKPPANKKPSIKKPTKFPPPTSDSASGPKRNPLPNSLALGPPPAKPNRPPKVDLDNIKRGAESSENGPSFKKPIFPTPPPAPSSNQKDHVIQTPPLQPALPNLPPRHPGNMIQEDVYDDVDQVVPPPLPAAHPSQKPARDEIDDDDDGEMYEDLDGRWEEAGKSQEKKEKEEKKRLEAAKKDQKERERKEQDARKKFKLVGPLEVIQKGKALSDSKGGKTDLAMKQGEQLDIIRVQGNPEGKWLARSQDGSIGYVKTTSVEIDFNSLKNHPAQPSYEPEVYDDIDVVSTDKSSGIRGSGVVLPPLPGDGEEIYDDVVDPNLEVSSTESGSLLARPHSFLRMFERNRRSSSPKVVPPPSQFTAEGNSDKSGAAIDEDIYDDVDSQNAPPLPPINNFPGLKNKIKAEDMDPKKHKKFEREEKEFRKKFKYEGEIQVLYQVSIIPTLNNKKWCGKDLPVKAGEKLNVIIKAQDDKLVCRNEEGKFGYVSTSHIVDDGEIYDDIGGDDCIYDND